MTLKLWGGDVNENLLILHADGRQVGYRSRGDIGLLDYGSPEPAVPGRFYYVTLPLPMSATYRRERVEFEIVSTGRIWEPGRTFEQYQKKMLTPSRGLYRFYVHDHSYFKPPAEDRQGARPEPVLPPQQPESFEALKERVNRELDRLLGPDGRFTNQMQLLMAAEAAGLEWSRACRTGRRSGGSSPGWTIVTCVGGRTVSGLRRPFGGLSGMDRVRPGRRGGPAASQGSRSVS